MNDIYTNGAYWDENPTLHEEDQDYKYRNIIKIVKEANMPTPKSILDVGCGSGKLAYLLSKNYNVDVLGIDLSKNNIDYARKTYAGNNLKFDVLNIDQILHFDIAVVADVFEHINDYYIFLEKLSTKANYIIFNIPLDISVFGLFFNSVLQTRKRVRHVHYFYGDMILNILNEYKMKPIKYRYINNRIYALNNNEIGIIKKVAYTVIIGLSFLIGKKYTALIFGGYSMTVLCHNTNQK